MPWSLAAESARRNVWRSRRPSCAVVRALRATPSTPFSHCCLERARQTAPVRTRLYELVAPAHCPRTARHLSARPAAAICAGPC